jgi:tight adherence protein B
LLIPLAVFLGVVLLILGVYWAFVLRQEEELVERLRPKSDAARVRRLGVLKPEEKLSSVGPLDAVLHRSSALTRPLQELVLQSGVRITLGTLVLLCGCFAVAGYLIGVLVTGFQIVGLLLGLLLLFAPYAYVKRQRTKRLYQFEEQFPEAIDLISRALRAGHALPTGLGMVADEIPAPVGTEFRILYDEQNFGLTLTDAIRNFAARIPVLDARFFATAVLTQRETGGNLAEVLDNLASVIRERFKVKRQVRVISAHGRITGWVLACLPPCVGLAAFAISPYHIQTLLGDPLGINMMIAAAVMQVLGTLIIRKIVNIEY